MAKFVWKHETFTLELFTERKRQFEHGSAVIISDRTVAHAPKTVDSRTAVYTTRRCGSFLQRVARRKSRPWCARAGWTLLLWRGRDVAKPTDTWILWTAHHHCDYFINRIENPQTVAFTEYLRYTKLYLPTSRLHYRRYSNKQKYTFYKLIIKVILSNFMIS
jgi:hypothetical protein